eukprot:239617-Lingulodinium_polyedra.AAC.1
MLSALLPRQASRLALVRSDRHAEAEGVPPPFQRHLLVASHVLQGHVPAEADEAPQLLGQDHVVALVVQQPCRQQVAPQLL